MTQNTPAPVPSSSEQPARRSTAIDAVATSYYETLLELIPNFATELGIDVIETSHEASEDKGLEEFAARIRKAVEVSITYYRNPVIWRAM